jgi:hypothetical protein
MDIREARGIATGTMDEHNLFEEDWSFEFDNAKRRLGYCDPTKKLITISKYFTGEATEEQFRQAMLHEVAHALLPSFRTDGTSIGHGPEWRALCRRIGYTGDRLAFNPYSAKNPRKTVSTPRPAGLKTYIKPGDILWMDVRGKGVTGRLVKRGRTRFHIEDDAGNGFHGPFSFCVKVAEKGSVLV